MTPVLLDTGPIVALLDRSENHHRGVSKIVVGLDAPLVTCEAVIAEACYLLRGLKGAPAAILDNIEAGNFLIPYRMTGRGTQLAQLVKKYASIPMDLADACLVDLAGQLNTGRILSLDGDFRIYRWGRNRPFEFLMDK